MHARNRADSRHGVPPVNNKSNNKNLLAPFSFLFSLRFSPSRPGRHAANLAAGRPGWRAGALRCRQHRDIRIPL